VSSLSGSSRGASRIKQGRAPVTALTVTNGLTPSRRKVGWGSVRECRLTRDHWALRRHLRQRMPTRRPLRIGWLVRSTHCRPSSPIRRVSRWLVPGRYPGMGRKLRTGREGDRRQTRPAPRYGRSIPEAPDRGAPVPLLDAENIGKPIPLLLVRRIVKHLPQSGHRLSLRFVLLMKHGSLIDRFNKKPNSLCGSSHCRAPCAGPGIDTSCARSSWRARPHLNQGDREGGPRLTPLL
jgi:hypothetical protein